jgi:glycerol uptake facilitator-like aquaporin
MASIGKLSWRKVIHYFLGQYIGAFLGAVIAYLVYREAIIETFGSEFKTTGENGTAAIFGTFTNEKISTGTAVLDQV